MEVCVCVRVCVCHTHLSEWQLVVHLSPRKTEKLLQELFEHLTVTDSNSKSAYSIDKEEGGCWHSLTPFCIPIKLNLEWTGNDAVYLYKGDMTSSESKRYSSLARWTAFCLPQFSFYAHCWGRLPGQQCEWLTQSCQRTTARRAPPSPNTYTLLCLYKLLLRQEIWQWTALSTTHCGCWITGSFLWPVCHI